MKPPIRLIHSDQADAAAELRRLREPLLLDRLILDDTPETRVVRDIIADVRQRGDQAVSEITARVDHAEIPPASVRVPHDVLRQARDALPEDLLGAIRQAIASVRAFQKTLLTAHPEPMANEGRTLSIRFRPVRRVGVCVPAAAAPLPSSAIHCAVPAQVAGVKEIALVAPPRHDGDIHPTILATAYELRIDEVYRMGGAQAIAALAFGTDQVPRVDKIVGPGGPYVQLAKRCLYGVVDIDMFAATTEVLIIADASARAEFIAADMLAQAEHNPGSSILLTNEYTLAAHVLGEIEVQLSELANPKGAANSLEQYSAIVIVRDMDEAVELANEIAPEHLQIETQDPARLAERIDSAGATFLGHYSPEAAGDYVAGPSHTLPTGGTARFWSGLSALSFLRGTSMIEYTPGGLVHDASAIELLAHAENLDAHANAVMIRTRKR